MFITSRLVMVNVHFAPVDANACVANRRFPSIGAVLPPVLALFVGRRTELIEMLFSYAPLYL